MPQNRSPRLLFFHYSFLLITALGLTFATLNRLVTWNHTDPEMLKLQIAYGVPSLILAVSCLLSIWGLKAGKRWGWWFAYIVSLLILSVTFGSIWMMSKLEVPLAELMKLSIENLSFASLALLSVIGLNTKKMLEYFGLSRFGARI